MKNSRLKCCETIISMKENMGTKIACRIFILSLLYLFLFMIIFSTLKTYVEEPTTFEENYVFNNSRIPSFTICPRYTNYSFERFQDVTQAIKEAKLNWHSTIKLLKPFG